AHDSAVHVNWDNYFGFYMSTGALEYCDFSVQILMSEDIRQWTMPYGQNNPTSWVSDHFASNCCGTGINSGIVTTVGAQPAGRDWGSWGWATSWVTSPILAYLG